MWLIALFLGLLAFCIASFPGLSRFTLFRFRVLYWMQTEEQKTGETWEWVYLLHTASDQKLEGGKGLGTRRTYVTYAFSQTDVIHARTSVHQFQ